MNGEIHVHPSSLAAAAGCERRYLWRLANPEGYEDRTTAAAAVGTYVHNLLAEQDAEAELQEGGPVALDNITPTVDVLRRQAVRMAETARFVLEDERLMIERVEHELGPVWMHGLALDMRVVGRLDIQARADEHAHERIAGKRVIIDTKTSASESFPSSVWLQVGAYGLALKGEEQHGDRLGPAFGYGVLHVPRVPLAKDQPEATLTYAREGDEVEYWAWQALERISDLLERPDKQTLTPGWQCAGCEVLDCIAHPEA